MEQAQKYMIGEFGGGGEGFFCAPSKPICFKKKISRSFSSKNGQIRLSALSSTSV